MFGCQQKHVFGRQWTMSVWVFWCFIPVTFVLLSSGENVDTSRCEEITIPMCRGIGYNLTFMPNQFNHDTQDEAGLEVHQFWPLVEIQCSSDLKFFLCSMYAPICIEDYGNPLPACRSVCERAKAGCAPLMRQYGFAWPERMNCDRLPDYGDSTQLCMDSKNGTEPSSSTGGRGRAQPKATAIPGKPRTTQSSRGRYGNRSRNANPSSRRPVNSVPDSTNRTGKSGNASNSSVPVGGRECSSTVCDGPMPCYSPFFSEEERAFATFWIGLWSCLCLLSTSLTVATFLIEPQRFRYPERPIVFLSACYLLVSLGYVLRLALGHPAIACDGAFLRSAAGGSGNSGGAACTAVFLLTYLFGMASAAWWVVLALTWLLAAGLKWGAEAIAALAPYFHLGAWLLPSAQTAWALAAGAVDGDPVAGVCTVGSAANLRAHLLWPLLAYLALGSSFLLAGFVALCRIRDAIKAQGRASTDKLEKLMVRIGAFGFLYAVPAAVVVACLFYEQRFRDEWRRAAACPSCPALTTVATGPRPDHTVFMVKYFMMLVVGITSGFWIWSGKTIDSWRRFSARLRGGEPQDGMRANLCQPIGTPGSRQQQYVKTGKAELGAVHNIQHGEFHKLLPLSHV